MSVKPSNKERLSHILIAIERIFRFRKQLTFEEYCDSEMAQFAIIKNFEIIGEAAYHLPKEIKAYSKKIEWRKVIAFRHILVHEYYSINPETVWNAIENKLGDMKLEIEKMIEEEE